MFRFRIQDKPRGAEISEKEMMGSTLDSLPDNSAAVLDLEALEEEARQEEPGEMQAEAAGPEESEETQAEAEAALTAETGDSSRRQTYDPMLGKYRVTLENGVELISTVPEGYMLSLIHI